MSGDHRQPSQPSRGRVPLDTLDSLDSLRPSSLPPELGDLDFKWDDDLASAPAASRTSRQAVTKLELDLDLDEGDRPTAVPEIPMDQFVARAMAAAEREEQDAASSSSIQRFDMRARMPTLNSIPDEAASSYPPTLTSNRVVVTPMPAVPMTSGSRPDPLAVDLSEIDGANAASYVTPTEPPDMAFAQQPTVAPTDAGAIRPVNADVVSPNPPSVGQGPSRTAMKDRYATGDFTGALEIAEALLSNDSADLEAQRYATSCRDVLTQMYLSRLGGLDQVINVVLPPEELRWLNLDHRAGFLLSMVDGASTIEELLDISGMPRLDALRILATLREQRAILLGPR
jgi:hypothetical protein